jgi:hypothetical protein
MFPLWPQIWAKVTSYTDNSQVTHSNYIVIPVTHFDDMYGSATK